MQPPPYALLPRRIITSRTARRPAPKRTIASTVPAATGTPPMLGSGPLVETSPTTSPRVLLSGACSSESPPALAEAPGVEASAPSSSEEALTPSSSPSEFVSKASPSVPSPSVLSSFRALRSFSASSRSSSSSSSSMSSTKAGDVVVVLVYELIRVVEEAGRESVAEAIPSRPQSRRSLTTMLSSADVSKDSPASKGLSVMVFAANTSAKLSISPTYSGSTRICIVAVSSSS